MLNYVAEMLCFCQHPMKWTATGETMTGDGSGLISREGIKEAQEGKIAGLNCVLIVFFV
jgi:hypothetical protein